MAMRLGKFSNRSLNSLFAWFSLFPLSSYMRSEQSSHVPMGGENFGMSTCHTHDKESMVITSTHRVMKPTFLTRRFAVIS